MPLANDYILALEKLSLVFATYQALTGGVAVLVGGAAAAIYTAGQFPSGDFDVVAVADDGFKEAMVKHGFLPEDRQGYLLIGFYHPDHPEYGFQQVSGSLFEGRSDRGRLVYLTVKAPGMIALPPIEDMIADRLGQHAVASPSDTSMLRQAKALFSLADNPDLSYLHRRICEEDGDPTLLGLAS